MLTIKRVCIRLFWLCKIKVITNLRYHSPQLCRTKTMQACTAKLYFATGANARNNL